MNRREVDDHVRTHLLEDRAHLLRVTDVGMAEGEAGHLVPMEAQRAHAESVDGVDALVGGEGPTERAAHEAVGAGHEDPQGAWRLGPDGTMRPQQT